MDFDPRRSPRAWVYGICRRVASEHRRSSERARKRLRLLPRDAPAPSPEDQVATREAVSLVHEFLAGLDACTQQLFTLSELEVALLAPARSAELMQVDLDSGAFAATGLVAGDYAINSGRT